MRLIVAQDAEDAARLAAEVMTQACAAAISARGRALIAVSGGETPWQMLRRFATAELPWKTVHVTQVDERCVPRDDSRRNLGMLQRILIDEGPLPEANLLAMPVEQDDLEQGAVAFSDRLAHWLGAPGTFDLVQLGLGADGHTASLVPDDRVLAVHDRNVAVTSAYQGTRRMTLTLPVLSAARERLWLVTGAAKADALAVLLAGEGTAPAGRVERAGSTVVADEAALTRAARDLSR